MFQHENATQSWDVKSGGVVGEMSAVSGGPRAASVVANSNVGLWELGTESFLKLLECSPKFKEAIFELIESRTQELKRGKCTFKSSLDGPSS